MYPQHPIVLVDDEPQAIFSLNQALGAEGIDNTIACHDSRDVLPLAQQRELELVLLDLSMPHLSGEELLTLLTSNYPDIPVIVITGHNEIDTAVRCLKAGAFDYLVKPVEQGRLTASVVHALEHRRLRRENTLLKQRILCGALQHPEAFSAIVTNNGRMHAIFQYCETIATSTLPVLITGETGVGKELIAQALHKLSGRSGPFVTVNVAGLDDGVFSDTLFGHRKGAFTGADEARQGLVARASGGTLFLDEIGDLSPASQLKLLRLVQEHEYYPVGSDVPHAAQIRIIAATNKDIHELQRPDSNFRRDLFYRLCNHHIHLPPLRERRDDLPLLFEHFMHEAAAARGCPVPENRADLLAQLIEYDFPGNIRELKSLVYDAVSRKSLELPATIAASVRKSTNTTPLPHLTADNHASVLFTGTLPSLDRMCMLLINEALRRTGGNQSLAARMLNISRQTLIRYMKKNTTV
ncbi:MAG: sigma-54 dependent transcriptional regulator [Desulfobacterota bacterium]|nr:sigma-54 dependent transcriptional regulator [Thermodesulfobacteriota bacterium]